MKESLKKFIYFYEVAIEVSDGFDAIGYYRRKCDAKKAKKDWDSKVTFTWECAYIYPKRKN